MQTLKGSYERDGLSVVAVNLDQNRHGVLRYTHIGFQPVDRATYETQLRELLAEK